MGEAKSDNVVEHRNDWLSKLEFNVHTAFENRAVVKFTKDKKSVVEDLEIHRKQGRKVSKLHGNRIVNLPDGEDGVNEVSVTNPHDFKILIEMSLEELARWYGNSNEWVKRTTEETLEHEFEHHVPALGQNGLRVRYSVGFFEDSETGGIGIGPKVVFNGKTTAGILRRIFGNVKSKSQTDSAFLQ